jgi:hypothetical protein
MPKENWDALVEAYKVSEMERAMRHPDFLKVLSHVPPTGMDRSDPGLPSPRGNHDPEFWNPYAPDSRGSILGSFVKLLKGDQLSGREASFYAEEMNKLDNDGNKFKRAQSRALIENGVAPFLTPNPEASTTFFKDAYDVMTNLNSFQQAKETMRQQMKERGEKWNEDEFIQKVMNAVPENLKDTYFRKILDNPLKGSFFPNMSSFYDEQGIVTAAGLSDRVARLIKEGYAAPTQTAHFYPSQPDAIARTRDFIYQSLVNYNGKSPLQVYDAKKRKVGDAEDDYNDVFGVDKNGNGDRKTFNWQFVPDEGIILTSGDKKYVLENLEFLDKGASKKYKSLMHQYNDVANVYLQLPDSDSRDDLRLDLAEIEKAILNLLRRTFTPMLDQPRNMPASSSIDIYDQTKNMDPW